MSKRVLNFGTNKQFRFCLTILYLHGMWPRENSTIFYSIAGYIFQTLTTYCWTIAKCIGTPMLETRNEIILFGPSSLYSAMSAYRGFSIMRKFKHIDDCINTISEFEMNEVEYEIIQKKIKSFSRTSSAYTTIMLFAMTSCFAIPAFSEKRVMPIPIWLPYLDWESNVIDFYIGLAFSFIGIYSMAIVCSFTPILVWYLLYGSSLTLEIIGHRLRNIGHTEISEEKSYDELVKCLKLHQEIIHNIKKIKEIFSKVFFLQITSSALCICGVTYVVASESFSEHIKNFIMYFSLLGIYGYEIFVLIDYGNEIALVSDQLSFRLYECNWTSMSRKCRKLIIIYQEQLERPHELVVGKVFTMRMKLLSSILNMAYSIFNILRKDNM